MHRNFDFNQIKKQKNNNKNNTQIKPEPTQQNGILTLVHAVREGSKENNLILQAFWGSCSNMFSFFCSFYYAFLSLLMEHTFM